MDSNKKRVNALNRWQGLLRGSLPIALIISCLTLFSSKSTYSTEETAPSSAKYPPYPEVWHGVPLTFCVRKTGETGYHSLDGRFQANFDNTAWS